MNLADNGRDLGRNGLTIAEALGSAGYNTAMIGKWHLSSTPELTPADRQLAWLSHRLDPGIPFTPDITTYPAGRGFQRHYGTIWGVVDYFDPFSLVDGFDAIATTSLGFAATLSAQAGMMLLMWQAAAKAAGGTEHMPAATARVRRKSQARQQVAGTGWRTCSLWGRALVLGDGK